MSNPRLPLPDEHPVHVYRPRQRKLAHPWARSRGTGSIWLWRLVLLAGVAVLIVGMVSLWRATSIPVTVVVNGQPLTVMTHRRTVGGAIRASGVRPGEALLIDPPAATRLHAGMVITVASQRPVIVHTGPETLLVRSAATTPAGIAADAGIVPPNAAVRIERAVRPGGPQIVANPALAEVPILPREISIQQPVRLIITHNQATVALDTTASTLGAALREAGYHLYEADIIEPPLHTSLTSGEPLAVTIRQAIPVTIDADGRAFVARTHQATVADVLQERGLALTGGDYVRPPLSAPVQGGDTVQVVRVREEIAHHTEPLPYETLYVPDPDLPLDQQAVVQAGQMGELTRQIRYRYENDELVSEAVEGAWITEPPRPEVIAFGTDVIVRELRTEAGILHYWRKLRVLATSYSPANATASKQPGDPDYGITATGAELRQGVIAVDPAVIPLYTRLYVPGYGTGQALDVGGAVKGLRIDLGYTDAELQMWNQWVDVYLLTPVPASDVIPYRLPE